jgi:hypothetical protein
MAQTGLTRKQQPPVTVLRTWGQLGRQLARSRRSVVVGWEPTSRMIKAAAPLFQALAGKLNNLLARSDRLLKPLADPLRTDFGAHRWLSSDREEAYSDWLAWIVQRLQSPAVLGLFAIKELFPDKPLHNIELQRDIQPVVLREPWVPQGHSDKHGRLDLVIRFEDRAVLVVETKVGHADRSDTAKQHGYAEWLNKQEGKSYPILLASDGEKQEYAGGFRLLKWADLCLALRRLVVELCAKEQIVLATMALAFVGAVEQNLLGFSIAAVDDFQQGRFATFDPTVVVHLEKWIDREGSK